jgi:hypothetical protein
MMFDATPVEGEPGVIVGFMEGAKGIEAGHLAPPERRALVIEQAERALGPPSEQSIGYVDRDWSAEEWTKGLLRRPLPARSLDPARAVAPRARRAHPLGRHGNRRAVDGIRRRRHRIRHQSCGRGTRGLFLTRRRGRRDRSRVLLTPVVF